MDDEGEKIYNTNKSCRGILSPGDVAIAPGEKCYKIGRVLTVNGKKYTINDKCGTKGRLDIWRGVNPRKGKGGSCP